MDDFVVGQLIEWNVGQQQHGGRDEYMKVRLTKVATEPGVRHQGKPIEASPRGEYGPKTHSKLVLNQESIRPIE